MITSLTAEQEALLQEEIKKGLEMGLSVGDPLTDVEPIRQLIKRIYVEGGETPPEEIIYAASPKEALEILSKKTGKSLDVCRSNYSPFYGQHEADFFTRARFYRQIGVEIDARVDAFYELALLSSWTYLLDKIAVVCAKPVEIVLDSQNRLHNPHGPALKFADGFSVYVINGVRFFGEESKFITTPVNELVPSEIIGIQNTQQRAEIIRRYGVARLKNMLPHQVLDSKSVPGRTTVVDGKGVTVKPCEYKILSMTVDGYDPFLYLEMTSPTTGETFIEETHPDVKTVIQARSFQLFGDLEHVESDFPEFLT